MLNINRGSWNALWRIIYLAPSKHEKEACWCPYGVRGWKLRTWLFDSPSQVLLIWCADILVTFSPLSEAAGLVRLYTLGLFSVLWAQGHKENKDCFASLGLLHSADTRLQYSWVGFFFSSLIRTNSTLVWALGYGHQIIDNQGKTSFSIVTLKQRMPWAITDFFKSV